ncbi:hypothetical protein TRFO_28963 [Tritrichomonas foetus]|uniref:Arb2 domain-containing protein n=1 Tax=Tritrichomonas foetus TaxID=1144522 RepID=A0A1J4K1H7_9EUKA|nr:hypothetical protein TRFO_28963 [Tritrichomonas foetus]|eukprot:OHT03596.1 hypothetical protein TRFO_28963 [Tritrichomonas foetus]
MSEENNDTRVENSWTDPGTGKTLHFNEDGKFIDDEGNGPQKGFKNDNKFGDWLHAYVQQCLIDQGLIEFKVDGKVPIFHTKNAFNSPKKLLVLICGAGRILAGLWSVGVCAYHGINAGSVLPCLVEAQKRDMEVVIFNPNHPKAIMTSHSERIFRDFVIPANPERVWIIAHSMGGSSTCSIISANPEWCIGHVAAVAMTDGCEGTVRAKGFKINAWCHLKGINWVKSKEEVNSPLTAGYSAMHRSANTNDHPLTTYKAFTHIWEFFDENGADKDESPPLPEDFVGDENVGIGGQDCIIA